MLEYTYIIPILYLKNVLLYLTNRLHYLTYLPQEAVVKNQEFRPIDITELVSIYYMEHDGNFFFGGETHDFWELQYIDSGEIAAVAGTNGYNLPEGSLIFYKPMQFHAVSSVQNRPHNLLIAAFRCKSSAMKFFEDKVFFLDKRKRMIVAEFFTHIAKSTANYAPNINLTEEISDQMTFQLSKLTLERLLLTLVSEKTNPAGDMLTRNNESVLTESIKAYLENNLSANITLADICTKFNVSKSYVCRLFKSENGNGIIDYYISRRIKKAKYLIREHEKNFTQISEELGFSSIHHFTRSFKSQTGMTPSAYAKSVKERTLYG